MNNDFYSHFDSKNEIKQTHENRQSAFMLILLFFSFTTTISAHDYPFILPDTVKATLDVVISKQEAANNNLLGYNFWTFKTSREKELAEVIGGGTITKSPDSIFYEHGTEVTLTATPDQGFLFTEWSGHIQRDGR